MMPDSATGGSFKTSIAPWLSVRNGAMAVGFYKAAFGAAEVYHMDGPDGSLIARLSVEGGEFWVSGDSLGEANRSTEPGGGGPVRMILTVADPDAVFAQALKAGASEVFPVGEDHGWLLGRLVDPFGLHWEIGRPLGT
jgi:PhnB protein